MPNSPSPPLICSSVDCKRPFAGPVAFCPFCGQKQVAPVEAAVKTTKKEVTPPPLPASSRAAAVSQPASAASAATPAAEEAPAAVANAQPVGKASEMADVVQRSSRATAARVAKPARNDWPLMLVLGAAVIGIAAWVLFLRDGHDGSNSPDSPETQSVPAVAEVAQDVSPAVAADHAVGEDGGVLQIVSDDFFRAPKKLYPLAESDGVFKSGVFLFLENDTVALCLDSGECMPARRLEREDASRQARYADIAHGYRVEIDGGLGFPLAVSSISVTGHPLEESETKIPASTPFISVLHGSEISKALVVTMNFSRFRAEAVAETDAGFARRAKQATDIAVFLSYEPSVRERGAVSALKELPYIGGADWLARSRLVIRPVPGTTDMAETASGACEFILRWSEFEGTSLYLVDQQEQVHIQQCTMAQVLRQERDRLAEQQLQQQTGAGDGSPFDRSVVGVSSDSASPSARTPATYTTSGRRGDGGAPGVSTAQQLTQQCIANSRSLTTQAGSRVELSESEAIRYCNCAQQQIGTLAGGIPATVGNRCLNQL